MAHTLFKAMKQIEMRVILNILAAIFVLGWLLGVFVFAAGFLIHILLILAIFAFIINFLTEPV